MTSDRSWEQWDRPGVAAGIDDSWRNDVAGFERLHRQILAELVRAKLEAATERLLEVGCGSGLVYEALVPGVLPATRYVGVDTSEEMLAIARRRCPEGAFLQGDAYDLKFPAGAFDVVVCFEVISHLPESRRPIQELLRVARRLVIFTVWVSPEGKTANWDGQSSGSGFLYRRYDPVEIAGEIQDAADGQPVWTEVRTLSDTTWAFIVLKGEAALRASDAMPSGRMLPFGDITRRLISGFREASGAKTAEAKAAVEAAQAEAKIVRECAASLSADLDTLRSSRSRRLLDRFPGRGDLRDLITPAFRQLLDDTLLYSRGLRGFKLQPSVNLQRVRSLKYRLDLPQDCLAGVLLATIVEVPFGAGVLAMELVSQEGRLLRQAELAIRHIDPSAPVRFEFAPLSGSTDGPLQLRVFVRDADTPLRILEWRKYRFRGLGSLESRAFCGALFGP